MYHTVPLDVGKNQVSKALDLEMLDKAKLDKQIETFLGLVNSRMEAPKTTRKRFQRYWLLES